MTFNSSPSPTPCNAVALNTGRFQLSPGQNHGLTNGEGLLLTTLARTRVAGLNDSSRAARVDDANNDYPVLSDFYALLNNNAPVTECLGCKARSVIRVPVPVWATEKQARSIYPNQAGPPQPYTDSQEPTPEKRVVTSGLRDAPARRQTIRRCSGKLQLSARGRSVEAHLISFPACVLTDPADNAETCVVGHEANRKVSGGEARKAQSDPASRKANVGYFAAGNDYFYDL